MKCRRRSNSTSPITVATLASSPARSRAALTGSRSGSSATSHRSRIMDDIVKQALAKWPNVPHCTGWLLLDRRGNWRMRDEAAQARGAAGVPIRHEALLGFINRNYESDALGHWFFQNRPHPVYVELGYTPWIVRLTVDANGALALTDHAGGAFEPAAAYLDDEGGILFTYASTPPPVAVLP